MAFCSHCGKPAEGGCFCSACGSPITTDAVESMMAALHRHDKRMLLIVVALAIVFIVTALLVVSRVMHMEKASGVSRPGQISTPAVAALPKPSAENPRVPAMTPDSSASQIQQPAPQVADPGGNNPAIRPSTDNIDPQAVQSALSTPAQQNSSPQQPAVSSVVAPGSDRYPGSQPIEVKGADIPDIGIPVASAVYTTSDSVATVIGYYRQRYPDAEVSEVNGQKIVAVNQPGAIKVIAVGTNGTETRIAIVQPAN